MAKKKKRKVAKRKTVTRAKVTTKKVAGTLVKSTFSIPLKDPEILAAGKELALRNADRKRLTESKKAANADFNVKLKDVNEKINELATAIKEGKRDKTVEANMIRDFDGNKVTYHYKGEVIHTRTMTQADRQESMDLDEKKLKKSLKTEAKKKTKPKTFKEATKRTKAQKKASDIKDVIKQETSKKTKRTALDGSYRNPPQLAL